MKHLILNGFMATGKTTVGRLVAGRLDLPFIDLDEEIERRTGGTVGRTFLEQGEAVFRGLEAEAIRDALSGPPTVIALGGGALLDDDNRERAESAGCIITLTCPAPEIECRVEGDEARPLLETRLEGESKLGRITALLEHRAPIYDLYPQVSTATRTPETAAEEVETWFRVLDRGDGGASYRLHFPGGLDTIVHFGAARPTGVDAVITDETVGVLHHDDIQSWSAGSPIISIRPGEDSKSLAEVERIYERLYASNVERGATVAAAGGGVVCDVAGFAAATFLRGCRFVALPTTLLAQVDAAIGGKTGVDFKGAKNLIGSFHPASDVYVDHRFLNTLDDSGIREGLAEMVKIAMVRDEGLFAKLQSLEVTDGIPSKPELIRRAIRQKIAVVAADPWERTGRRALLNFGHTAGHALESAVSYTIPHGECVAIGMMVEARIAENLGLLDRGARKAMGETLQRLGLPMYLPTVEARAIVKAMRHDKKRSGGTIRMIMLTRIGEGELAPVEEGAIHQALMEARAA